MASPRARPTLSGLDRRLQQRAERHEVGLTSVRALAAAYAIGLVPALAVALGQPVWSRVDEAAHYDVIAQYAAGVYPHDSVTTIRPETLQVMQQTGVYGFVVDNSYQRPDAGFQAMPSGLSDAEHVVWIRRHGWQYSYEAFQPPLYYALALPAWKIGDRLGGALGALYGVRIFDALLAALLAPLAMLIALRLWPANPGAGWGAAVLTAAMRIVKTTTFMAGSADTNTLTAHRVPASDFQWPSRTCGTAVRRGCRH